MDEEHGRVGVPINEAVYFLERFVPSELERLSRDSLVSNELRSGIIAGEEERVEGQTESAFIRAKAEVMLSALANAKEATSAGVRNAGRRIRWIRRSQLVCEILVLAGSTSILGTIALGGGGVTIAAVATFAAACGNIFVEQASRIVNPNLGNVFDAFQNLYDLSRQVEFLKEEIALAIRFQRGVDEVAGLIANGNELMSRVNKWDPQVLGI